MLFHTKQEMLSGMPLPRCFPHNGAPVKPYLINGGPMMAPLDQEVTTGFLSKTSNPTVLQGELGRVRDRGGQGQKKKKHLAFWGRAARHIQLWPSHVCVQSSVQ